MKRVNKLSLIAVSVMSLTLLLSAGKVLADTFPGHDGITDADVAIRGANSGINNPTSRFEITTKASYGGQITVTVLKACDDPSAGDSSIKASINGRTQVFNDSTPGSDGTSRRGGDCD